MSEGFEEALEPVDEKRRSFLKKMVVGGVFAVPTVASFTMTGIDAVYAQTPSSSGTRDGGDVSDDSVESTTTTSEADTTTTTEADTTTTSAPDETTTTTTTQPNQPPIPVN